MSWMIMQEKLMLDVRILCAVAIFRNLLEHLLQISLTGPPLKGLGLCRSRFPANLLSHERDAWLDSGCVIGRTMKMTWKVAGIVPFSSPCISK